MLSDEIKEYCETWDQKLSEITGDSLNDVFNVYMNLFPKYNKLYDEASDRLLVSKAIKSKGGDKIAATKNVVKYLGAEKILDAFTRNNNLKDIEALTQVIHRFNIILKDGKSLPGKDTLLLEELKSPQTEIRMEAVLKLIYHVRCNIFHGHKAAHEYQRLLLDPLVALLRTMNDLLYAELSKP